MAQRKILATTVALIFVCFLAGCGKGLSSESKAAADKALISLRKMDAAAEQRRPETPKEYQIRLVETRAEVEQTLVNLPEGGLKKEISNALEVYLDKEKVLALVWEPPLLVSNSGSGYDPHSSFALSSKSAEGQAFIERLTKRYGVGIYKDEFGIYKDDKQYGLVRFDTYETLAGLKKVGRAHIDRASSLLKE